MTLEQLAVAAGTEPKWLLNSSALLGRKLRRTAREASWWGLVHLLESTFKMPLQPAALIATDALKQGREVVWLRARSDPSASAAIVVNLQRYRSVALGNLSRALQRDTPKQRGRRQAAAADPVAAAIAYGLDLDLIRAALDRSPAERLRTFESLLQGLTEARIAFVVVGGVAAAAHGATWLTNGLDICYDGENPENVAALGKLLSGWNAYPRGVEKGQPFLLDDKTLRGAAVMTLASSEGDIDVMDSISGVGPYKSVLAHSERILAFDLEFRVLDLPTLIEAKRAAGRARDFERLPELEALLALRQR
jgi:hypothetical protein